MARDDSPFHAGERALQMRVGVRDRMAQIGRKVIRDFMPDQHRTLFTALPFVVVGALDGWRRPWASVLVVTPGFMSSPDPRTLRIAARPGYLVAGAPAGLLGIQLETRRRNRMNGTVIEADEGGFVVRVDQSFGNCPQYIQARDVVAATPRPEPGPSAMHEEAAVLSDRAAALVSAADTFFIASASARAGADQATEGVDVSHRGGKPGFVWVTKEDDATVLTAPDFRGNNAFNTFGNLVVNPRAGLLFLDFAGGDLLSVTGHAEVLWDDPAIAGYVGAKRLLRVRVEAGVLIEGAVPFRWTDPEQAPQLASTGSWI